MRELEECQKEAAMLTHALTDKKAEHQIEVNRNRALEGQLEKSQQNEKKLESLVVDFQSSNEVAQRMESFVGHVGTQMGNAFRKLAVLSQRINFASGRVQFLQGLFTVEKLKSIFYSYTSDWTLNLFLSHQKYNYDYELIFLHTLLINLVC